MRMGARLAASSGAPGSASLLTCRLLSPTISDTSRIVRYSLKCLFNNIVVIMGLPIPTLQVFSGVSTLLAQHVTFVTC